MTEMKPRTCAADCGRPLTCWHSDAASRNWHPECLPPGTPMPLSMQARIRQLEAELEENTGVLKALRRQRDQAEAERDRLRTGMGDLFTRWFLNAHAGLGFREAMMGIAADLQAVLDGAPCPGESQGCNCSCEGCKHHCAAHQPPVTSHTYKGET